MSEKKVYAAIIGVMSDMSKEGISKDQKNTQQNYKFRGIDDVLNALSPVLVKNNLVILPRVVSRTCEEGETKQGGRLAYVTVDVEYDFTSAIDGSIHVVRTIGEAMDSADKATNKAMSAAYKYACIQAFCIPTEGDNDADKTTYEAKPKSQYSQPTPQKLGPNVSDEERKRNANLFFSNKLKLTPQTEAFKNFKSICESFGSDWRNVALNAEQMGISTYEGLMDYTQSLRPTETYN